MYSTTKVHCNLTYKPISQTKIVQSEKKNGLDKFIETFAEFSQYRSLINFLRENTHQSPLRQTKTRLYLYSTILKGAFDARICIVDISYPLLLKQSLIDSISIF